MSGGQRPARYISIAEYARRVELEAERHVVAIRSGSLTLKELKQSGVNADVYADVCKKLAELSGSNER